MSHSEGHGRFDGDSHQGGVWHVHFIIMVLDIVVHRHIVFCSHLHVHWPNLPVHRGIQGTVRPHAHVRSPLHRCGCCE